MEKRVSHAPSAPDAERDCVALERESISVEDPVAVGVVYESLLYASNGPRYIWFCYGRDAYYHCEDRLWLTILAEFENGVE